MWLRASVPQRVWMVPSFTARYHGLLVSSHHITHLTIAQRHALREAIDDERLSYDIMAWQQLKNTT